MDAKEIKSVISALDKSTDDGEIIKLLNHLNTGVKPSEKLLRETKVGVAVNKLRSHKNIEVNSLVKKMIKYWKDEVSNEKKLKSKQNQSASSTTAASPSTTSSGSPGSSEQKPTVQEISKFVSTKPRNPKNDAIKVDVYEQPTRNASITALYTALAIDSTEQPQQIFLVARDIEKEVFRLEYMTVNDNYRNKLRSLTMNLRNKKNPELRSGLLSKSILPATFVKMKPEEMAPEALKQEIEKLHKKNLFDAQGATEKRAITDRFTCGKCKEKKVSYYQMQTRSADEPLTTFCTCENCGNRWKFS